MKKPKVDKREWRWWKHDPEKLTKLRQAFQIGASDKIACRYAEISKTQLYYYQRLNPEFTTEKRRLKDRLILKAMATVIDSLDKPEYAWRYIERKLKTAWDEPESQK